MDIIIDMELVDESTVYVPVCTVLFNHVIPVGVLDAYRNVIDNDDVVATIVVI